MNKVKSPNQRVTNPRMTIHFDAAFNSRDFKSMAGMVAWDQKGVLLTTKTGRRGTELPADEPGG